MSTQHIRELQTFREQSGFFGPPCIFLSITVTLATTGHVMQSSDPDVINNICCSHAKGYKVWTLGVALLTGVRLKNSSILRSPKWQLIDMS